MKDKILILSFGRNNSMPIFSKSIVENFSDEIRYDIMVSKYSEIFYSKNEIRIPTYTSQLSFLLNTIIVLPIYLLKVLFKIKQYKTLYLPYHHFWDIPFIMLFKLCNKRIVFTVHDGILHQGEDGFFIKMMHKIRLKFSTDFIFLTEFVEKSVSEKYRKGKNSVVIPHGLITNAYWKPKVKSNKNLLFLGRISKYKGVELLIETIADVEGDYNKLIIAGKSNYKLSYSNHPKIEVQDKYLTEEEIGNLLTWADILILPYTEATQSGVISLGITAEIPMICTNVGGFREQLLEDECVWVAPNKKSLKSGIEQLINDVELSHKYQAKMKIKKQNLSWREISFNTQQFLS